MKLEMIRTDELNARSKSNYPHLCMIMMISVQNQDEFWGP